MSAEDEPGETKMTPVTKLFPWKIVIAEEAQKLAIIHRTSTREYRFPHQTPHRSGLEALSFRLEKTGHLFLRDRSESQRPVSEG